MKLNPNNHPIVIMTRHSKKMTKLLTTKLMVKLITMMMLTNKMISNLSYLIKRLIRL